MVLLFSGACDEDFVEVNTDPYAVTDVDPALLFAGAQRSHLGTWAAEHTIVQQFVIPYTAGATDGFNFNSNIDEVSNPKWDQSYTGAIRNLAQALVLLDKENSDRVNLRSMIRIWKAQVFMGVVDAYGDVPYFDAGKAVNGLIFYPEYNDDAAIYEDLYSEIKAGIAALNPDGDFVSADLFYGVSGKNATTNAADQVAKWKKLGNSLLLRLGMRYSKINPGKAAERALEAFTGGVMTSNADNAYIKYGVGAIHTENNNLRNFSQYNYAAEAFVNQLKSTSDPRGKFIVANFADPGAVVNDTDPDTVLANQFGVPIGVLNTDIVSKPAYRGARGGGLNYSQMNIWAVASPAAPDFYVTYAQTLLLLAEAAHKGWISGSAKTYYDNAIRADMDVYKLYPSTTPITESEIATYLAKPDVAFNTTDALELINTQYWIINIRNGTEAFANFRRSGYPALAPNPANNNLNGGFVRRLSYPDREASANAAKYTDASSRIGGDNLLSRVFWDIQ
jgi:hypothetical protein